jgi:trans-aconitate 2-methyltransferase
MTEMAAAVLDRLPLRGDEVVLDAGCGTGRVSLLLLERLPRGRVVAVDADPAMVAVARRNLPGAVDVRQADLLELTVDEPVDAVFSTATFHWVLDHDRLFGRLFAALRPGGRLVAQCGGDGNIAAIRAVGDELAADPRFAAHFAGWSPPWQYATPEATARRLTAAGFVDVRTWLQRWPVVPDDPAEYLRTIVLGAQVQRLPPGDGEAFVAAALERLPSPLTVEYVRLNLDATRPG